MNLDTLRAIGEETDSILRLKTPSVGITCCTKETDIPLDEFSIIDHPIPFCSVVGLSRYFEMPVYIPRDQIEGQCIGVDYPYFKKEIDGEFAANITGLFTENEAQAATIITSMKRLDKDITGIAFFPLKCAPHAARCLPDLGEPIADDHGDICQYMDCSPYQADQWSGNKRPWRQLLRGFYHPVSGKPDQSRDSRYGRPQARPCGG